MSRSVPLRPMSAAERKHAPSSARDAQLRALAAQRPRAPQQSPRTNQASLAQRMEHLEKKVSAIPVGGRPAALTARFAAAPPVAYETNYEPTIDVSDLETVTDIVEQVSEAEEILVAMRAALKKRTADADGYSGIQGLGRNFRICDRNGNKELDLEEFTKCVTMCKLGLSALQIAKLHAHFDRDRSGSIDYDEFLRAVRGPLPPARRKLVLQVYNALDALGDGNGVLSVDDIAPHYDVSKHPDVVSGKIDGRTALTQFFDGFEGKMGNRDGVITVQEWLDNYADISASIDTDDYFGQMMTQAWGHLKKLGASGLPEPALKQFVSQSEVDTLEKMLFDATYRRKGGSYHAQERLINETFKIFDKDGSGDIDKKEFLKAMERFGLHIRGKGRPGVGGLPEEVVTALFDRYDADRSGTLSFREFSNGFLKKHQTVVTYSVPATEYTNPRKKYQAGFEAHQVMNEAEVKALQHLKKPRDPELMGARAGGILSQAVKVHGSGQSSKSKSGSGAPFR